MKIEKNTSGNIIIKNSDDTIEQVIATDVFIQKHPRDTNMVLLSKSATNQNEQDSIVIPVDKVTEIDGTAFSGDRNDLLVSLSELFSKGGGDGTGSQFSGDYNDLTNLPDLNLYQPKLTLGGSIFCVFAEEGATLGSNAFEWAFGNGDDSQNGFGLVLPFACKLVALTLNTRQGSGTIEAFRNTTGTGKRVSSNSTTRRAFNDFKDDPIDFNAGDSINFKTITASGATEGGKATAWFKME